MCMCQFIVRIADVTNNSTQLNTMLYDSSFLKGIIMESGRSGVTS